MIDVEICSMMQLHHLGASFEHRDMYFDKVLGSPENAPRPYIHTYIYIYIYICMYICMYMYGHNQIYVYIQIFI